MLTGTKEIFQENLCKFVGPVSVAGCPHCCRIKRLTRTHQTISLVGAGPSVVVLWRRKSRGLAIILNGSFGAASFRDNHGSLASAPCTIISSVFPAVCLSLPPHFQVVVHSSLEVIRICCRIRNPCPGTIFLNRQPCPGSSYEFFLPEHTYFPTSRPGNFTSPTIFSPSSLGLRSARSFTRDSAREIEDLLCAFGSGTEAPDWPCATSLSVNTCFVVTLASLGRTCLAISPNDLTESPDGDAL